MKQSAGILMYRIKKSEIGFLLVHPGGPFWKNKDAGAWTIPKGEINDNEDPLEAAIREFTEETGFTPQGNFVQLIPIKQKSGKSVKAWAVEGDMDATQIKSNTFRMQWPPNSGRWQEVPEVDKAEWFTEAVAKQKIILGVRPYLYSVILSIEAS